MAKAPFSVDDHTPLHATLLENYRLLHISGADAQDFLQGQFTQDVAAATPEQARLSAYCTAKGRMLASFVLWEASVANNQTEAAGKSYFALIRADIAEGFAKRLRMFVLRSQVSIVETDIVALGYWVGVAVSAEASGIAELEPWQVAGHAGTTQIALPAPAGLRRGILVPSAGGAEPPASATNGLLSQWAALDVLAGIPWVEKANQELFIPQDMNLDAIGAVSFTKGCYPGQEVVARSHYRGKLKRRMLIGTCDDVAIEAALPGTDIIDKTNTREPCGQVVNSVALDSRCYLLFETRLDAAEQNQLALGNENGPAIALRDMPYTLDKPALS